MAISYKPNNITYVVPSVSLPTASHPSTNTINQALNDVETLIMLLLSSCKPSIEDMYDGLLKLSKLYECLHDFINVLCSTQNKKWVEELMEKLVGFLDACNIMRDIMSCYKEHVRDLQCALRRRKGNSHIKSSIARYNCFRKTVKKDVKRLVAHLKKSVVAKSQDCHHHMHHEVVINMVMEVTVSVFESTLMPFFMPNAQTPTASKWSMVVSKLVQRTRVACEGHHYQQTNDIDSLDVMLCFQCVKDDRFLSRRNDTCIWEAMDAQIERILECIFRSLIRTRASLLNIVSNY